METIAKVQDVFANRYELGFTVADARTLAKKLFTIADERDEAIRRTGRYANDAFFAPKALRWLDEQETELLDGLGKNTNSNGRNTWYNGENSNSTTNDDGEETSYDVKPNGYIQVPGQSSFGPKSKNPAVNCYGYILMNLGIQPSDGNYDIQPGQLSENGIAYDHAHAMVLNRLENTDLGTITNFVIRDFEKAGRDVRIINSYEDANKNEIVIALKNKDTVLNPDYHFAILLDDGTWADKQGTRKDSRQGAIKNPDETWEGWLNRYNTETVYFAISNY